MIDDPVVKARLRALMLDRLSSTRRTLFLGAPAAPYAEWFAGLGHEIEAVESSDVPDQESAFDAAVVIGPLSDRHLQADRVDYLVGVGQAMRPGGLVIAVVLGRYAPFYSAVLTDLLSVPGVTETAVETVRTGAVASSLPTDPPATYAHSPADVEAEFGEAGFDRVEVVGVDGYCALLAATQARMSDLTSRAALLAVLRDLEHDEVTVMTSSTLVGISTRAPARVPA
jgi:hypothetical protein